MNIWDLDKLFLFIAFVIPGFISLKAYELINPGNQKDSSKQLIDAITYSCFNYALLLWPIVAVEKSSLFKLCPNIYSMFYLFVLFLAPVIWAFIWNWLRKLQFIQNSIPHPKQKPWDYIFSKRKSYWIKVTLNNGSVIAGKYSSKSFSSSSPAEEQIYLEESWLVNENGGLERKKNKTEGIIILSKNIEFIELIEY